MTNRHASLMRVPEGITKTKGHEFRPVMPAASVLQQDSPSTHPVIPLEQITEIITDTQD